MSGIDDLFNRMYGPGAHSGLSDDTKRVIGFMAARVKSLEEAVASLNMAIIVLINAKEKRSSATIPGSLRWREPTLTIEYGDEVEGKRTATIRIQVKE